MNRAPLILLLETSGTNCSVALVSGERLLAHKELDEGYSHAENLHLFIESLFLSSQKNINDLDAVAVSEGPGSYTGLRIGVTAAKGIAFALTIPLIAIPTLRILAASALSQIKSQEPFFLHPMLDARRMEVYTCTYDSSLNEVSTTKALVVNEYTYTGLDRDFIHYFFGDGMNKCKELIGQSVNINFIEDLKPSSLYMHQLALKAYQKKTFQSLATFEPLYLKEFFKIN